MNTEGQLEEKKKIKQIVGLMCIAFVILLLFFAYRDYTIVNEYNSLAEKYNELYNTYVVPNEKQNNPFEFVLDINFSSIN